MNTRSQISIPKEILEKIIIGEERVFKVVANNQNQVVMIPITTDPVLPQSAIDAMVSDTLEGTKKAKNYRSMDEMFDDLDRSGRKRTV